MMIRYIAAYLSRFFITANHLVEAWHVCHISWWLWKFKLWIFYMDVLPISFISVGCFPKSYDRLNISLFRLSSTTRVSCIPWLPPLFFIYDQIFFDNNPPHTKCSRHTLFTIARHIWTTYCAKTNKIFPIQMR